MTIASVAYSDDLNPEQMEKIKLEIGQLVTVMTKASQTTVDHLADDILMIVMSYLRPDLLVDICIECGKPCGAHGPDCYHMDCDEFESDAHGCGPKSNVTITPTLIRIGDHMGVIAEWEAVEWYREPRMMIEIAEHIKLYYEEGPEALRERNWPSGDPSDKLEYLRLSNQP